MTDPCQHLRLARTIVGETAFYKCSDGWISVTERLPAEKTRVLVWFRDDTVNGPEFYPRFGEISTGHWRPEGGNGNFDDRVTYWRPLPPTPRSSCHRNFTAEPLTIKSLVSRAACGGSPMSAAQPYYTVTVTFGIGEYRGEWTGHEERMDEQYTVVCESPSKEYAEQVYKRIVEAEPRAQEEGRS